MEFQGLDIQGKMLVEETTPVSWVAGDDRRLVRDSATDRLYIGKNGAFGEILQNFNYFAVGWPASFKDGLDNTYHPLNGTTGQPFAASSYSGDGTDYFRVTNKFLKLSDNTLVGSSVAGIKVETGSTGSDIDDAYLWYSGATDKWIIKPASGTAGDIATETWVTGQISTSVSGVGSEGRLWHNVIGSRSVGTTYTNLTGDVIAICVTRISSGGDPIYLTINGVLVCGASDSNGGSDRAIVFGIIPVNASYKITGSSSITIWSELY